MWLGLWLPFAVFLLLPVLSLMGWLYLRAGDKILQHPERQCLSSKVVRRQVSFYAYIS